MKTQCYIELATVVVRRVCPTCRGSVITCKNVSPARTDGGQLGVADGFNKHPSVESFFCFSG